MTDDGQKVRPVNVNVLVGDIREMGGIGTEHVGGQRARTFVTQRGHVDDARVRVPEAEVLAIVALPTPHVIVHVPVDLAWLVGIEVEPDEIPHFYTPAPGQELPVDAWIMPDAIGTAMTRRWPNAIERRAW